MTTFHAKVRSDSTVGSNVQHQGFAGVSIQVVRYETPLSIGIATDQSVNVFEKVFLGSGLANQWRENLAGGNMQVPKQPKGPVTNVFVFTTSKHAASRKQISGNSLQCLDARLLINRDRVDPLRAVKLDGIAVGVTYFEDLSVPSLGIIDLGEQPVLTSMRLNIGAILKKTTPQCVRCSGQFRV